ncbi:hypothetical protein FKM82_021558 [Ascaphus truei]
MINVRAKRLFTRSSFGRCLHGRKAPLRGSFHWILRGGNFYSLWAILCVFNSSIYGRGWDFQFVRPYLRYGKQMIPMPHFHAAFRILDPVHRKTRHL